jgi:hypothetical protein
MEQEKLIWLSVMDGLVWKRNPLKDMVTAWTEKSRHILDIPKNRQLTQQHLDKERRKLSDMEAVMHKASHNEWGTTGERLNHLR